MSEERTGELSKSRSFEERVFARFDAMDARFGVMEERFAAMEGRFESRFNNLESRLERVETHLGRVEDRLDSLDSRVQALEARALDTKPIWERALAEILMVKEHVQKIERKFEVLAIDMIDLRTDQRGLNLRFEALESKSA